MVDSGGYDCAMTTPASAPEDIRLLCLDVDGVLTDGSILLNHRGEEIKRFFSHDGVAIRGWLGCARELAIITARDSGATERRFNELGVRHVFTGVKEKGKVFQDLLQQLKLEPSQAAMVGDELPDLPVLRKCGYAVAVANAVDEVKAMAHHVTTRPGGKGAVREVVEHLLRAQGRWEDVVSMYDSTS